MKYIKKNNEKIKLSNSNIKQSIDFYLNVYKENLDLNSFDVSNVTNFSHLFENNETFNGDISSWDMRKATTIERMFYNCSNYKNSLSKLNFRDLTNFNEAFLGSPIDNTNSKNYMVIATDDNLKEIINNTTPIQQKNCNSNSRYFQLHYITPDKRPNKQSIYDLSFINTSKITNMNGIFKDFKNNIKGLDKWNVSNVIDMSYMFMNATLFNSTPSTIAAINCTQFTGEYNLHSSINK